MFHNKDVIQMTDYFFKKAQIDHIRINQVDFPMIYCPAGEFWMGSHADIGYKNENPRHKVKLTKGFWMGQTPVTQEQWQAVMGYNESGFKGSIKLPAEAMTWYDCLIFCNQLSELQGLKACYQLFEIEAEELPYQKKVIKSANVEWDRTANGYRLPTEAEWEYSAKADTKLIYSGSNLIDEVAWYGNDDDSMYWNTYEVMTKKANAWGLYDMSGNVWEWCQDMFDEGAYQKRSNNEDPVVWQDGPCHRVIRGGECGSSDECCRVTYRSYSPADERYVFKGFRILKAEA